MERAWEKADRLNLAAAAFFATWVGAAPGLVGTDPDDAVRWVERELSKPRVAQAPGQRNILLSTRAQARFALANIEEPVLNQNEQDGISGLDLGSVLRLSRGEWEQGADRAIPTSEALRIAGNRWMTCMSYMVHGRFLRLLGRPEAEDALLRSISLSEMQHLPMELVHRALLAQLYGETGRVAEAMSHLARCHEILDNGEDWRAVAGHVALADGVVAAFAGSSTQDFDGHFAHAVDVFQRFHTVWDEAEALHAWGRALVLAGEKARAIAKFDTSLEIYRRIGAGERWMNRVLADKVPAQGILKA